MSRYTNIALTPNCVVTFHMTMAAEGAVAVVAMATAEAGRAALRALGCSFGAGQMWIWVKSRVNSIMQNLIEIMSIQ